MVQKYLPIAVNAGESPLPDSTQAATNQWTQTNRVRFYRGFPETLGGWQSVTFEGNITVDGCSRSLYSQIIGSTNVQHLMLGTHTSLYSLVGTELTNITPLQTSTTAIANSLDSDFSTLANDPIDTIDTSNTITINETGIDDFLVAGDRVEIIGSSAVNGIPAIDINTTHLVRTVITDAFTVIVATAATSTGSGGGASITRGNGIITVNATAHGLSNGERVKIAGATTFAGLTAAKINAEHIIRNVNADTFDIVITDSATSNVTGGGGAGTTYAQQIVDGTCDPFFGRGYGMGKYGVGRYGVSKTSANLLIPPRVYSFARFGTNLILTPGEQTGTYTWDGDVLTAPLALSNAPTAINYVFVSNNIVVTLGASGVANRIKWSDQGDSTFWDETDDTRQAGEDDIEGANKFLSHALVRGVNLLFTPEQVFTMRYIGFPFIWEFKRIDDTSGIISQNARVTHNGIVYWMANDNFYFYAGGSVKVIPKNSIRKTIFDELDINNKLKCFAWINEKHNEVWFHYPSLSGDGEPDKIAILDLDDGVWSRTNITRSAAESPFIATESPRLIDENSILFRHEVGVNDDGAGLNWSITTPKIRLSDGIATLKRIIPDSVQTGDITLFTESFIYPQSTTPLSTSTRVITPNTNKVDMTAKGRYVRYTISQDVVDGSWRAGAWMQRIEGGEIEDND